MVNLASSYQPASSIWPILSLASYGLNVFLNFKLAKRTTQRDKVKVIPPPKFFAIWGPIFAAVCAMSIYLLFEPHFTVESHLWLIASNLSSVAWVLFANSDMEKRTVLMLVAMGSLLLSVSNCWRSITAPPIQYHFEYLLFKNIMAFYLGWVTMAACISIAIVVVFEMKIPEKDNNKYFWGYSSLLVLAVVYFCMNSTPGGNLTSFLGFFASAAWGVTGVIQSLSK